MDEDCSYCGEPIGDDNWGGIYANGVDYYYHHPDDEDRLDCYSLASGTFPW